MGMKRDDLSAYLDELLRIKEIDDPSDNGLQVEGGETVTRLALAVDASLAAFDGARAAGAQMLIVHHGLFWGKPVLVTGPHRRRLGLLFDADISLYAAHLPLDLHEEMGNNATLARWLELEEPVPFGSYGGQPIGMVGRLPAAQPLGQLATRVQDVLGEPLIQVWPFGPASVRRVGIVSGGAAFLIDQAAEAGVDVYLTGEMSHSSYHQARELGLNVIFGGHYATETAGLKTLADHLAERFDLETVFLDLPTGA
jgi:dinuclear metal center YbgI/SA1388 family protein